METEKIDRLSNLPDSIIHHILSFVETKQAVQTSVLSKSWKHQWKHTHSLNFDTKSFVTWIRFAKFVHYVLHNHSCLNLCRFRFHCRGKSNSNPVGSVFYYAKLHGIQELETDVSNFSPSFLECQSLRILKLGPCDIKDLSFLRNFASLKNLELCGVRILDENQSYDLFSSCLNLEILVLIDCLIAALENFYVSCPRLVNLIISNLMFCNINNGDEKIRKLVVSAPKLNYFEFQGMYPLVLSMNGCQEVQKVNIHMHFLFGSREIKARKQEFVWDLICMAEDLSHAISITLSLDFFNGGLNLQRNSPAAETTFVEFNKETQVRWRCIGLAKVRQHYGLNGPIYLY